MDDGRQVGMPIVEYRPEARVEVAARLITTHSLPLVHYLRPKTLLRGLWSQRGLIRQLTWRNVLLRYRGSVLGLAWSFLLPLLMLVVYTFVFGVVFQIRWPNSSPSMAGFAITLYCGLLIYTLVAECLSAAPFLILGNPNYVKKVVFPLEVLPVCTLGAALANFAVGLTALLICSVFLMGTVSTTIYLFPLVVLPLLPMALGVSWFLASLGVYLRDIGQVMTVVLQVLMYVSPIFYTMEQVPPAFRIVMRINPLTFVVENARRTLLWNQTPEWGWLTVELIASLIVLQLGYVWFMKTRRGFADVL